MLSDRPIEIMRMRARVRRLTREERERICNAVEAAVNGGWGLHIFTHDSGTICSKPVQEGKTEVLSEPVARG